MQWMETSRSLSRPQPFSAQQLAHHVSQRLLRLLVAGEVQIQSLGCHEKPKVPTILLASYIWWISVNIPGDISLLYLRTVELHPFFWGANDFETQLGRFETCRFPSWGWRLGPEWESAALLGVNGTKMNYGLAFWREWSEWCWNCRFERLVLCSSPLFTSIWRQIMSWNTSGKPSR